MYLMSVDEIRKQLVAHHPNDTFRSDYVVDSMATG